ncbi:toxin-antitoxin system HicB family antitoxin [Hoyosella rhizosphaerae]|uniref:Toxin-antitoxin system HicB family antitoxin n=1 Tax=Hoyosella rhizosphaerae TaxID=1755582 RepID=A0A916U5W7_9ACTN|nr:toxin-antitoxin system HicB family antitoxin [Hoyosella rhizosphaerae]MBN4926313.1 toxin-antitoxin system HicB family antitoxin [Hoyosella rhizosphaerae]GGC60331.1 hypothetical protein GCM10011410_11020 [Hoyosella rhizosphaerae]
MDLSQYTSRLLDDLTAAASLGDDRTQQIAATLAKTAEPSLRLILMSALSDFAKEVSLSLDEQTVEARLDGNNIDVVIVHEGDPVTEAPYDPVSEFEQALDDFGGNISRVTLRLVDNIKSKAEEAANANGVSLNSWVGQAVRGALRDQGRWAWEPPHHRPGQTSEPQDGPAAPPTAEESTGPETPNSNDTQPKN